MGGGASVQNKRYMGGKVYFKFFKEDVWSLNEDVLEYVGLTEVRAFQVFVAFASIDVNENGVVSSMECFKYFGIRRMLFTERLFYFEKEEDDGTIRRSMNFMDFMECLWSFCSLSSEGLARYIFEIFDVDNSYVLEKRHVRTMFKMLYDIQEVEDEYLQPFLFDEKQHISKAEFIACTGSNRRTKGNILLKPALEFQKTLRKRSGGISNWKAVVAHRNKILNMYDKQFDQFKESVEAIIEAGIALGEARREAKDPQHVLQQQSQKIQNEAALMQRELQQRQMAAKQERRRFELLGPDRLMKRAWAAFEALKQIFLDEEFTTEDAVKRQAQRSALFAQFDQAVEIAADYYEQQDIKDREATGGTVEDHEARYQDYIAEEGGEGSYLKRLLELNEVLSLLMRQIEEKNSKNRFFKPENKTEKQVLVEANLKECRRLLDQISDPSLTKTERTKRVAALLRRDLTEEENIAMKLSTRRDRLAAEVATKEFLARDLRVRTLADFEVELAAKIEERRRELIRKEWDVTTNFGSRITEWEWVLDKQTNKLLYVSNKTGQRRHPKTAICEKCDAIMVQSELRCLVCDAPRSAKNLKLYRPLGFKDITLE